MIKVYEPVQRALQNVGHAAVEIDNPAATRAWRLFADFITPIAKVENMAATWAAVELYWLDRELPELAAVLWLFALELRNEEKAALFESRYHELTKHLGVAA